MTSTTQAVVDASMTFSVTGEWNTGFTGYINVANQGDAPLEDWTLSFDAGFDIRNIWSAQVTSQEGDRYLVSPVGSLARIEPGEEVRFGFNGTKVNGEIPTPSGYILNPHLQSDSSTDGSPSGADSSNSDADDGVGDDTQTSDQGTGETDGSTSDSDSTTADTNPDDTAVEDVPGDSGNSQSAAAEVVTTSFEVTNEWGNGFTGLITLTNTGDTDLQDWQFAFDGAFDISNMWHAEVIAEEGDRYVVQPVGSRVVIPAGGSVTIGFNGNKVDGVVPVVDGFIFNPHLQSGDVGSGAGDGSDASGGDTTGDTTGGDTAGDGTDGSDTAGDTAGDGTGDSATDGSDSGDATGDSASDDTDGSDTSGDTADDGTSDSTDGGDTSGDNGNADTTGDTTDSGGSDTTDDTAGDATGGDTTDGDTTGDDTDGSDTTDGSDNSGTTGGDATDDTSDSGGDQGSGQDNAPEVVAASFEITNDWGSGFTGLITLTNTGDAELQDWQFAFDGAFDISSMWHAEVIAEEGDRYTVQPVGSRVVIPAGGSVTIGFTADKIDGAAPVADGFTFNPHLQSDDTGSDGGGNSDTTGGDADDTAGDGSDTAGDSTDGSDTAGDGSDASDDGDTADDGSGTADDTAGDDTDTTDGDTTGGADGSDTTDDTTGDSTDGSDTTDDGSDTSDGSDTTGDTTGDGSDTTGDTTGDSTDGSGDASDDSTDGGDTSDDTADDSTGDGTDGGNADDNSGDTGGDTTDDTTGDTGGDQTGGQDNAPDVVAASFEVTNDWGSGFTGLITLTNTGDAELQDWQFAFDGAFDISSMWHAEVIAEEGDRYTVQPVGSRVVIPAGGSVTIGFTADKIDGAAPVADGFTFNPHLQSDDTGSDGGDNSDTTGGDADDTAGGGSDTAGDSTDGNDTSGDGSDTSDGGDADDTTGDSTDGSDTTDDGSDTSDGGDTTDDTAGDGSDTTGDTTGDGTDDSGDASDDTAGDGTDGSTDGSDTTDDTADDSTGDGTDDSNADDNSGDTGGDTTDDTTNGSGGDQTGGQDTAPDVVTASFEVTNDWGNGFTGLITLTNTGDTELQDWQFAFDAAFDITTMWHAEVIAEEGDRYTVQPVGSRVVIPAGGNVTIGFNGDKVDGAAPVADGFAFNPHLQSDDTGSGGGDDSDSSGDTTDDTTGDSGDTSGDTAGDGTGDSGSDTSGDGADTSDGGDTADDGSDTTGDTADDGAGDSDQTDDDGTDDGGADGGTTGGGTDNTDTGDGTQSGDDSGTDNEPTAITDNPISDPVTASGLGIAFEEVVTLPPSGSDQAARLNFLTSAGDGTGRLFVNDMRGTLYTIADGAASVYLDLKDSVGDAFLDQSGQQGFSYFAFHPDFETNGRFYTVHSEAKDGSTTDFPITKDIVDNNGEIIQSSHHDVIVEWQASDPLADSFSGTSREVMRLEQPYRDHNIGQLGFNPNAQPGDADYGLLYIAVADGGSDGFPVSNTDPMDNGQDLSSPLGSILRIDPLGSNSANGQYGIPDDNPFVTDGDDATLGEIWAYGLRNPHRFSWDTAGDGKMLIADIGQNFIEEVNLGTKGANYGWGDREGTWVIDDTNEDALFLLPDDDALFNYTYPVAQYDHDADGAVAIAGGYVYRGTAIPELNGQYVFADFGSDGRFFHVSVDDLINGQQATVQELQLFDDGLLTTFLDVVGSHRSDARFGVGADGELYVTSKQDGTVRKLVSVDGGGEDTTGDSTGGTEGDDSTTPDPAPTFNYGEALQKSFLFYEAQRSGPLPDDNRIEWRGDSGLTDGESVGVDLTGGYHDAGDHIKFGFPMAYSMTMLGWGAIAYEDAYQQSGQHDDVLDAIKWGTDYILKAHVADETGTLELWAQVGTTALDHSRWGSAETSDLERPAFKVDRQNPGSDIAGESAAALAAASIAFRDSDPGYADTLLDNAIQLYDFADTYRGNYSDSIPEASAYTSWSGYMDELVWGALWLHQAADAAGLAEADSYLTKAEDLYTPVGVGWGHNWDFKSYGNAILLAQITGEEDYRRESERWLDSWIPGGETVTYTDGGLAWLTDWGSLRYSSTTAFLAGVYSDTVDDPNGDYSQLAESQVDYLLGDNPQNFSYLVGFGDDFALQPHHRNASGVDNINDPGPNTHTLYGALVGGPSAADDAAYSDSRSDFISNEVALDYNAGLTGALARMYGLHGGDPLSDAELNALTGVVVPGGIV